jgi:hypothetical protein
VLIAQLSIRGGSGLTIVAPAGWSLIRRDNNGSAITQALYSHVVPYWPAEPTSYTWTFNAGNDAAAGIADYVGVSNARIVDVSGAQLNASSANIVAPSVNVPVADQSDQLLYFFSIANSGGFLLPYGPTPEYGIVASGGGIGEGMSDLPLASGGATNAATAAAYTASTNVGAQVALIPGPPAPKPTVFLRSTATGSTATPAASVSINVPAGVQPGDLMLAQIAVRGGSSQVINPPSGWNLVRSDYSGTSIVQAIFSHVVPASPAEPASYTWSFKAGNNATAGIADFLGANGVPAVDVTSGQGNASSTSITAPSLTISSASPSDHLVCFFATAGGITMTTPAGTTQAWSFPAVSYGIGAAMSDIVTVSPGSTAAEVATGSNAYANVGAQVALH